MISMKYQKHLFILLLFVLEPVIAQPNNIDSTFHAIELSFESGSYISAELNARRVLEMPGIVDSTRVLAEKWIAFSLIAQGKSSLAKDHIVALLRLNPQFELDPILTSPKILAVFNETKSYNMAFLKSRDTSAVHRPGQSPAVSVRTVIFPGWEQLHTNKSTKGYLFLGGGIATLGAGIVFEVLRSSARNEYLSATSSAAIESRFSRYNKYYKAEIFAFSAFAVVYLASEIDVFANSEYYSLSFSPFSSSTGGSSLSLRVKL
jgi:hypothetical protein